MFKDLSGNSVGNGLAAGKRLVHCVGEVSLGSHSTAETGPTIGQQVPSPSNPVHVLQFY